MSSKRRRFSGELKAKVALEALRGDRTLQEIASQHQVHPNQVGAWKRPAIEGLVEVFSKGAERRVRDHESEVRDLHAKIGELIVERDFFCHAGPVDEPVDEPVGAPHDDCARPPGAEPEPTMAPAGARALLALLRAEGGERGDARADAADRRAVPEVSVLRRPSDGTSPAPRGRADRPTPGRAADAPDGASGNLSGAAHQPIAPPRAPGLALSAQGLGDRATEPCPVRRHHLYPGEPRLPLPCGGHGLGEPVRPGLAAVEHAGREFLHRHARRGPDPVDTASRRSSIPTKAASSPASPSPGACKRRASGSRWMAGAGAWTISSSSGCGVRSNTRRSTCTRSPTVSTARRLIRDWVRFYNLERPHAALDGRTPAEAYRGETPVDMMDKPLRALPTSPQAQQQQQEDRSKGILAA